MFHLILAARLFEQANDLYGARSTRLRRATLARNMPLPEIARVVEEAVGWSPTVK